MADCVLGDICRTRLNKIDSTILLSQYCQVCAHFKSNNDKNKSHIKYDDYETYYDYERDQFIIKRKRNDNEN